jgi:hypothetical protein
MIIEKKNLGRWTKVDVQKIVRDFRKDFFNFNIINSDYFRSD